MAKSKQQQPADTLTDKRKAQYQALKTEYGDIGRKREVKPVDQATCLRTPSPTLNVLTNETGLRPGAVVEDYGMEGTMKTWFALQLCRNAQIQFPDQSVAYIDTECAVDLWVAEHNIGIDMGWLEADSGIKKFEYFPDPEFDEIPTLEEILNRVHNYAASGVFSLIVIDSIASCTSLWEAKQEDITSGRVGGPGLAMSKAFKRIKAVCARSGTRLWCINQLREKFIDTPQGKVSKLEPGGGHALKFAATHRFRRGWDGTYRSMKGKDGGMLTLFAEKVKYGHPYQEIAIPAVFGEGIDYFSDLVIVGEKAKVITKNGTWYAYGDTRLGQGLANAGDFLRNNQELASEIEHASYAILNPPPQPEEVATPAESEDDD